MLGLGNNKREKEKRVHMNSVHLLTNVTRIVPKFVSRVGSLLSALSSLLKLTLL